MANLKNEAFNKNETSLISSETPAFVGESKVTSNSDISRKNDSNPLSSDSEVDSSGNNSNTLSSLHTGQSTLTKQDIDDSNKNASYLQREKQSPGLVLNTLKEGICSTDNQDADRLIASTSVQQENQSDNQAAKNLNSNTLEKVLRNTDKVSDQFITSTSVDDQSARKYGNKHKDLCQLIPNLYRLIELCADESDMGLVHKAVIHPTELEKVCKLLAQGSYRSISDIRFKKLAEANIRLVGCYGNRELIFKLLLQNNVIDKHRYKKFIDAERKPESVSGLKPTLVTGLYLLKIESDLGLVILWPEYGFYTEKDAIDKQKNATNLHRFLTRLTDHQICLLSEKDVENFVWSTEKQTRFGRSIDIKLMKSQNQQRGVSIGDGFEIHVPELSKCNQDPSKVYIIESSTSQTLAIMQSTNKGPLSTETKTFTSSHDFEQFWRQHLNNDGYALRFNKLSIDDLTILIKVGLNKPELLHEYENRVKALNLETNRQVDEYKTKIYKSILSILANYESFFEKPPTPYLSSVRENFGSYYTFYTGDNYRRDVIPFLEYEEFYTRHANLWREINNIIQKIDSEEWKLLKQRYYYATELSINQGQKEKLEIFLKVFEAEKSAMPINISSHGTFSAINNFWTKLKDINQKKYDMAIRAAEKTSDANFVQELVPLTSVMEPILKKFRQAYRDWKKKRIEAYLDKSTNLNENYTYFPKYVEKKQYIGEDESKKLKEQLKAMYLTGKQIIVTKVQKQSQQQYTLHYAIEASDEAKPSCKLKMWEFKLEPSTYCRIREDANYSVTFPSNPPPKTLYINGAFQIMKIYQFDNGKFVLILWSKERKGYAIFYEMLSGLKEKFKRNSMPFPTTFVNVPKDSLIAVSDSMGLMAIYDNSRHRLDIYNFSKDKNVVYLQRPNIIKHFSSMIKHLVWINNTLTLCFVEKNGQSHIFDLDNSRFKPFEKFPADMISVSSSPDGSCIFVLKTPKYKQDINQADKQSELSSNDSSPAQALVYFVSTDVRGKPFEVNIPLPQQWLSHCRFTSFENIQPHLFTVDLAHNMLVSAKVAITSDQNQYQVRRDVQERNVGKVRIDENDTSIVHGLHTQFVQNVKEGHYIVIKRERKPVVSIFDNVRLRVGDGGFRPALVSNAWKEYSIDVETRSNGYLDIYSLLYTKYPIQSCINDGANPLKLTIALDLAENSSENIEQLQQQYDKYMRKSFGNVQKTTKKDTTILNNCSISTKKLNEILFDNNNGLEATSYQADRWIIRLCTLIPIQIAVAKRGDFIILRNGLQSAQAIQFEDGSSAEEVSKSISFDWYEAIFKYLRNKPVKVVSSMGEQSCGKSYLLNHFIGTSFDGSAMRCTEGVWLSLAYIEDTVYVAMDYEGLNSIERTPQDDLHLTLLNASVSTMILFKNSFAISRDMSDMFKRFEVGRNYFGDQDEESKIFKALFCMIIKDVPESDVQAICSEFTSKIGQIVQAEKENNFISRLYDDTMSIIPWPVFNDPDFYKTFDELKEKLNTKAPNKYETTFQFMTRLKFIMAKLARCDWTSLDESIIRSVTAKLRNVMSTVVAYGHEPFTRGSEIDQEDALNLMDYNTGSFIDDKEISMFDELRKLKGTFEPLSDIGLVLTREESINTSKILLSFFENCYGKRSCAPNDASWIEQYCRFIEQIVNRRIERVKTWLEANLRLLQQEHQEVEKMKSELRALLDLLRRDWTLCKKSCNNYQCVLPCLKNQHEESDGHDCTTDHKCHFRCEIKEAHPGVNIKELPLCDYPAGHSNRHRCKMRHTCTGICKYNNRKGCLDGKCSKEIDHEGDHLCDANEHYCGEPCSLSKPGLYECMGLCVIPVGKIHNEHRCETRGCPIGCCMNRCQRLCESNDHLHALKDDVKKHICGQIHDCTHMCEKPGICKIRTVAKRLIYDNAYTSAFEYEERSQEEIRSRCIVKIPPNEVEHKGHHKCKDSHTCDMRCPYCEYFCDKSYEHTDLHHTAHGSMKPMVWVGIAETFKYDNRTFTGGETGRHVYCHMLCKSTKRHLHIDYCQNEDTCQNTPPEALRKLGIEHINVELEPNPHKAKDYISHAVYWKRSGFLDPYTSADEQEIFGKCLHQCSNHIHKNMNTDSSGASYCTLKLFHDNLNPHMPLSKGHISTDGHQFDCSHYGSHHIVFVIDKSKSMAKNDKRPEDVGSEEIIKKHDNRLGAVYESIKQFIDTRCGVDGSAHAENDIMSFILFDNDVHVAMENQKFVYNDALINTLCNYQASGGTQFAKAIVAAGELIKKYQKDARENVIIFLSDGDSATPEKELEQICEFNRENEHPVYLYTVQFSELEHNFQPLKQMVDIASQYVSKTRRGLQCKFLTALSTENLKDHFVEIAKSVRENQPTMIRM